MLLGDGNAEHFEERNKSYWIGASHRVKYEVRLLGFVRNATSWKRWRITLLWWGAGSNPALPTMRDIAQKPSKNQQYGNNFKIYSSSIRSNE
jgi:hypothetical protein